MEISEDRETTLILFDSDKPATDSTGLPLVKAIVQQRTSRKTGASLDTHCSTQSETVKSLESQKQEESALNITTEEEEKAGWWDKIKEWIFWILLIPALIIAIWRIYKLIKTKK